MSVGKPFVYFSESVLTPSRNVGIIEASANQFRAKPRLNLTKLWTETALSVPSQLRLHQMPGFRGEKFHTWLSECVDSLTANCEFADPKSAKLFRSALLNQLFRPNSYYVPEDVRAVLSDLESQQIGWGVIANDSHLYLAVLQQQQLVPKGPILQAQGPQMFKPLPQMWQRAWQKAPAASKHNLWFVGSKLNPCDNFSANEYIRSALVAPELTKPEPVSAHFRVRSVDDLRPYWLAPISAPDFAAITPPNVDVEMPFTSFRPKLPPKSAAEASLHEFTQKIRKQ